MGIESPGELCDGDQWDTAAVWSDHAARHDSKHTTAWHCQLMRLVYCLSRLSLGLASAGFVLPHSQPVNQSTRDVTFGPLDILVTDCYNCMHYISHNRPAATSHIPVIWAFSWYENQRRWFNNLPNQCSPAVRNNNETNTACQLGC